MKPLLEKIRNILRNRRTRQLFTRTVSVIAALIVFVTTYALVLPAITMETEALCGVDAHQHDDSCYSKELVCGFPEREGHTHTEECYVEVLVCGNEAHTHSAECYKQGADMTVKMEAAAEVSTESPVFAEADPAGEEAGYFTEDVSVGSESAYGTEECRLPEDTETDSAEAEPVSGEDSWNESTEMDAVTGDDQESESTEMDAVTDDDGESGSTEMDTVTDDDGENGSTEMDAVTGDDKESGSTEMDAVAGDDGESGSAETDNDFGTGLAALDKGSDEDLTEDAKDGENEGSGAGATAEEAEGKGISGYVEPADYPAVSFEDRITVTAGRLNSDTESGPSPDKVTELTVHVEADEGTFPAGTTMRLAQADPDTVAAALEGAVEGKTKGFHAVDISFWSAPGENSSDSAGETSREPVEIEPLKPIRVSITSEAIRQAVEDSSTAPVVVHVEDPADKDPADIVPADKDPADIVPADIDSTDKVSANIVSADIVPADKDPADIVSADKEAETAGADTLTFEADSFSVYAVVYTVDFHYEIDGKEFDFSIPGGSFVSLEHVVEVLGIAGTGQNAENEEGISEDKDGIAGNEAEAPSTYEEAIDLNNSLVSESAKKFVADVESVEFSDPGLLWVEKTEDTVTVGQIIESLGLTAEYSADLSREQISEINAQTVNAGDWALISLKPFSSEETLTVTMKNGDVFTILITDVQLPASVEESLLAYFSFDDNPVGSIALTDSSGNNAKLTYDTAGFDMAANNLVYFQFREGYIGNAFYVDDYYFQNAARKYSLQLTDSANGSLLGNSQEATISFWAKPISNTNNSWPFFIADNEAARSESHLNYLGGFYSGQQGAFTSERFANGRQATVNTTIGLNSWHYVTVTHSGDTMTLYVDGQQKAQQTGLPGLQNVLGSNSIFQIGRANWGNGEYFKGYIDEFSVYNRALTADEVSALYLQTYQHDEAVLPPNRALKTAVTDLDHNDRVIIYNRVWNEDTNNFDDYAIDGNGNLIPVRDSGDSIYWKGDPSLEWILTVYEEEGSETGYYELKNAETGKYLCPQNGLLFSDEPLGINLPGRVDDLYGSVIEKWDSSMMSYYGYKYENNQLVTASSNAAADDRDWEFYFALPDQPAQGQLETVETLDNPTGLTMKMFDYNRGTVSRGRLSYMTSVLAHTTYQPGPTQNILPQYYDGAFPVANREVDGNNQTINYNPSLANLFDTNEDYSVGGEVDNLFIKSIFDESGYYEYSAFDNYAYLNPGSGVREFTVYKQIGTPNDSGNDPQSFYYERGNFLPYNQIDAQHTSVNRNMYDENGVALLPGDPRYAETLYIPPDTIDYFFGMSIDAHFEMPKDGIDNRGNQVTYEFNGDDDMWVYIDGVLVLDLGGIHDARGGIINFTTGDIIYAYPDENSRPTTIKDCYQAAGHFPDGSPWTANTPQSEIDKYFEGNTFKDFSTHSMSMFYLERGAGASNLHMRFNLPIIPPGSFSVEKKVEGVNEDYANTSFAFKAFKADGTVIRPAGTVNCVYKGTENQVSFDPDGTFHLKPGETAFFYGVPDDWQYYVQELGVDSNDFSVAINGDPASIVNGTVTSTTALVDNRSHLQFQNRSLKPGALKLTKRVEGEPEDPRNPGFEFYIYLENTNGDLVPYYNGIYYVKKGNVYYEYNNSELAAAADQADPQYYRAGLYGAIEKIPRDFTIEVRDLLPGTHFLVTERLNTLPRGYEYKEKRLIAGTYDTTTSSSTYNDTLADGKIRDNTTAEAEIVNTYTHFIDVEAVKEIPNQSASAQPTAIRLELYDGEDLVTTDILQNQPVTNPVIIVRNGEEWPKARWLSLADKAYTVKETGVYFGELTADDPETEDVDESGQVPADAVWADPSAAYNTEDTSASNMGTVSHTVTNSLKTSDVPIDKTFEDFDAAGYYWEADFILEEREELVSGTAYSGAVTDWTPVEPEQTKTIHKGDSESARSFTDLPLYRIYPNGSVYRILYSATETAYVVRRNDANGPVINQWSHRYGLTVGDHSYAPIFPHDAGDENDDMGLHEGDARFYHIIVENHKDTRTALEHLDLSLEKAWEDGTFENNAIPDAAYAMFRLQRYVTESYREFAAGYDADTLYTVTMNGTQYQFPKGSHIYIAAEFKEGGTGSVSYRVTPEGSSPAVVQISRTADDLLLRRYEVTDNLTRNYTIVNTDTDWQNRLTANYITDLHVGDTAARPDTEWNEQQAAFSLNNEDGWSKAFSELVKQEEGTINSGHQNVYSYTYYLVETETLPSNYYAVMTDTDADGSALGDEQHQIGSDASIYALNSVDRLPGNLELTKLVAGNGASQTKEFTFTIQLTAPELLTLADSYPIRIGNAAAQGVTYTRNNSHTTATISGIRLRAGDVLTIQGLPAGTEYAITENDYSQDGYSAQTTDGELEGAITGTIRGGETVKDEVEVTNTYHTGSLTVEKYIDGLGADPDKEFEFQVTLTRNNHASGAHGKITIGDTTEDINFTNGTAVVTFRLKGRQKAELYDLQNNVRFVVEEVSADQNGYETRVVSTGGTVHDDKTVTGEINSRIAVTAAYTNKRNRYTLELLKLEKNSTTKLEGAVFVLNRLDPEATVISYLPGTSQTVTSDENGEAGFIDLVFGEYEIEETVTPSGYVLTDEAKFYIRVSDDGIVLLNKADGTAPGSWHSAGSLYGIIKTYDRTSADANARAVIENESGAELPSAGGTGTRLFTILGGILILGAGVLLWNRRRMPV